MPSRAQRDALLARLACDLIDFKLALDIAISKQEVWETWQLFLPAFEKLSRNGRDDLAAAVDARLKELEHPK